MIDKDKARKKIERWLKKIPKSEHDIPYFKIGNSFLTPDEAIAILKDKPKEKDAGIQGLSASDEITDQLDSGTPTPIAVDTPEDLVIEQVKARIQKLSPEDRNQVCVGRLGQPVAYSMQGLLDAINENTADGIEFKNAMVNYYKIVIKRLENG
jgi:hypothetical protein